MQKHNAKLLAVLFQKEEIDSALTLIQFSFKEVAHDFTFDQNDFYKNPVLNQIQDEPGFLKLLSTKAQFLEGKSENATQQNDLEAAFKTLELAIELIEKMRKSYQSEEARQFLNSKTSPIYKKAVQLSFDLFELTKNQDYLFKAFEISEKSKASILWQNLSENLALQSSSIPQTDLDALNQLEVEISNLEEKLFDERADETVIKTLQSQIFDLKLKYENRIAALEKQNPKYFQIKYQAPNIQLSKIINKLPNASTAILEYFYDDKNIYAFVIAKNGLTGSKIKLEKPLTETIKLLRENNVVNLLHDKADNKRYILSLNELHRLLIEPVISQIKPLENLIIIPHGVLQYLPFEMLASEQESDFRKLNFLIRKYNIQYEWSAAFWLNEITDYTEKNYPFIGFAPSYGNSNKDLAFAQSVSFRLDLSNLTYSIPEVEKANSYFSGEIFTGDNATESHFRQSAPMSQIIHLATHAFTDNIQPLKSGLAFANDSIEDGFLNAYEIYNLNLPADLAVMSACNTGYGQLAEGEGVMSLGRAFSYAGCKSVVMSLWLANDQSTSTLMNSFYKNLSKGMKKDEALRKAKIDYLKQADQLTAHPYFWAGIVAVGDMSPLNKTAGFSWWVLYILGMALLLFLVTKRLSSKK